MSIVKKLILAMLMVVGISLFVPDVSFAYEEVTGTGKVTAESLNVRSGPGKEYDCMGKVYSGNEISIIGIDGEWLKIEYQKQEGYVSTQYVKYELDEVEEIIEEEEEPVVEEVIEENETEDEPVYNYKLIFGILGAIVVLVIIILITIKSIKDMDDEYDDDEYEDDDEYDDDEYEDEEDDEYEDEDEEEDDEEEYEYVMVKRPKQKSTSGASGQQSKSVKRTDDFSIDIDPRYFD